MSKIATSLWMGELDNWIDEKELRGFFVHCPEYPYMIQFRVTKEKDKRRTSYAFIDFSSVEAATSCYHRLKNQYIPGLQKRYRLKPSKGRDESIFHDVYVKDIAPGVTEEDIEEMFTHLSSFRSAKIVDKDEQKACLVTFDDPNDARRSMDYTGRYLNNQPILVTPCFAFFEAAPLPQSLKSMDLPDGQGGDEASVIVANVPESASKEDIENHFNTCGPIKSITLYPQQAVIEYFYVISTSVALGHTGTTLMGNPLRVTLKKPILPKPEDIRRAPLKAAIVDVLKEATKAACDEVGFDAKFTQGIVESAVTLMGATPAGWLVRDRELTATLERLLLQNTEEYSAMTQLRQVLGTDPTLTGTGDISSEFATSSGAFDDY